MSPSKSSTSLRLPHFTGLVNAFIWRPVFWNGERRKLWKKSVLRQRWTYRLTAYSFQSFSEVLSLPYWTKANKVSQPELSPPVCKVQCAHSILIKSLKVQSTYTHFIDENKAEFLSNWLLVRQLNRSTHRIWTKTRAVILPKMAGCFLELNIVIMIPCFGYFCWSQSRQLSSSQQMLLGGEVGPKLFPRNTTRFHSVSLCQA